MNVNQSSSNTTIWQVNCSSLVPCGCRENSSSDTPLGVYQEVEIEAFFYIVVVIVFYATSIVLLLVKYARNDDEEETLKYQYAEFVKRERFQAPRYKNQLALERTKAMMTSLELANGGLVLNCPVITISSFPDMGGSIIPPVFSLLDETLGAESLSQMDSPVEFGNHELSPALDPEPISRSTSLCLLSYDTDLNFTELDMSRRVDCDDSDVGVSETIMKSNSF